MTFRALTPEMARRLRLSEPDGVYINGVQDASRGERAGLVRGMVIRRIESRKVESLKRFKTLVPELIDLDRVLVEVELRGVTFFHVITRKVIAGG